MSAFDPDGGSGGPLRPEARRGVRGDRGGLPRDGRFEAVPEFLDSVRVSPAAALAWLDELMDGADVVDASTATREYLLASDADGYDWAEFPAIAPAPGETLVLWAVAPDEVRLPGGRIVSRSYLDGVPAAWGAIVWSRKADPVVDRGWDVPESAAGVVELYLAIQEEEDSPVRLPVMRALIPVSESGRALRFELPGPDNMVQAAAFGPPRDQARLEAVMMLLLHPLVLTLARRHGTVEVAELQGQRPADRTGDGFPLARRIMQRRFQVPVACAATADDVETDLRQVFAELVGNSALHGVLEAAAGVWSGIRMVTLPATWTFVEVRADEPPAAGMPAAWGALCRIAPAAEAERFAALPARAARALEMHLAVQEVPDGVIRFPVATMYVPLNADGYPVPLENGGAFGGPVHSDAGDLPADNARMPALVGHILARLSRG